MKRKMRLVLEIEIDELSDDFRAECAKGMCSNVEELPTVADIELRPLGYMIAEAIESEGFGEFIWPGSDDYGQISAARVVECAEQPLE